MSRPEIKFENTGNTPSAPDARQDRVLQLILTAAALGAVLVIEWLRDPFAFF
jgi:hypothetical protein